MRITLKSDASTFAHRATPDRAQPHGRVFQQVYTREVVGNDVTATNPTPTAQPTVILDMASNSGGPAIYQADARTWPVQTKHVTMEPSAGPVRGAIRKVLFDEISHNPRTTANQLYNLFADKRNVRGYSLFNIYEALRQTQQLFAFGMNPMRRDTDLFRHLQRSPAMSDQQFLLAVKRDATLEGHQSNPAAVLELRDATLRHVENEPVDIRQLTTADAPAFYQTLLDKYVRKHRDAVTALLTQTQDYAQPLAVLESQAQAAADQTPSSTGLAMKRPLDQGTDQQLDQGTPIKRMALMQTDAANPQAVTVASMQPYPGWSGQVEPVGQAQPATPSMSANELMDLFHADPFPDWNLPLLSPWADTTPVYAPPTTHLDMSGTDPTAPTHSMPVQWLQPSSTPTPHVFHHALPGSSHQPSP